MKFIAFLFASLVFHSSYGQEDLLARLSDQEVEGGKYLVYKYVHVIPSSVSQCIVALSCSSPKTIDRFKNYTLEEALEKGLYNTSNRIRMNWKLELDSSPLTHYFYSKNVFHPRTMETVVLWALYQDLNGEEIKLKKIIRKSRKKHRNLEKKERKRLKNAYKAYKKALKKSPTKQQSFDRTPTPKNFEEWMFTY